MQVRQIKKFDEDFDTKEFAQTAQEIYIEAHQLLEKCVAKCFFRFLYISSLNFEKS